MRQATFLVLISALVFGSCAPTITTSLSKKYPPIDNTQEVKVIEMNQPVPENSEVLGSVRIDDTGFSTNCGWDVVVDLAKIEARKAGGDAIHITHHIPPSIFGSSCDRISANILKLSKIEIDSIMTGTDTPALSEQLDASNAEDIAYRNDYYPKFRAAASFGWSYLTAKLSDNIPSDFEQYARELKSGYHYGVELTYYFNKLHGVGFTYNVFRTANSIDNIYVTIPNGPTQYGEMSDDIKVDFIGPVYSLRSYNGVNNNSLLLNIGLGYLGYNNDAKVISDININGSTLGLCWEIGYDIGISENMTIGFQFSYLTGTLTELKVSNGIQTETIKLEPENYESLNRIDLSVGLRFQL